METKDTIGNIDFNSSTTHYSLEFILLALLIVVILLYITFKPQKNNVPEKEIDTTPKDTIKKPIPEVKEEKKEEKKKTESPTKFIKTDNANTSVKNDEKKPTSEPIRVAEPKKPIVKTIIQTVPIVKKPEIVVPEVEEQSKEKYICYNPINIFAQTEPLSYPYVMMPKPNCVIKFPRKGRAGRKGYKEEVFKEYIEKYFKSNYQVFDDRFILIKNSTRPFEPDFALVNEKNGINIFLDIEIDEPYEGTNDIENRKATHYKHSDTNRNFAFTNRGWVVIRLAEIQVHQQPDACCQFIAHILKSIHSEYTIPVSLQCIDKIKPVQQWSEEEAKQWSRDKYREQYLGIERFGVIANDNQLQDIEETELGESIEDQVINEEVQISSQSDSNTNSFNKLKKASITGKYVSFTIDDEKTIFKPAQVYENETSGFCYVKNEVKTFPILNMENIEIKDNYCTVKIAGHRINVEQISNIINTAIDYKKYIRMKYTSAGWRSLYVDIETGELIENKISSEESIRTISDVQLSINALDQEHIQNYRLNSNYLTAYCHKREEQRTFKFDRISEIEILDI